MHFYLLPYEAYTRVDGADVDTAYRVKYAPNEPAVDVSSDHTPESPGWAFVASETFSPDHLGTAPDAISLGQNVTAMLDAQTRQRVLDAVGVRVLSPQDILYALLIDPTPAEGGRRKPRGVQRTPSGNYEVVIGSLTLTWKT